jgi:glycosidase
MRNSIPLLQSFEFHISRDARDKYQFSELLFSTNGRVIFANLNQARQFSQLINAKRDLVNSPQLAVSASEINALALMDEIMHVILFDYRQKNDPAMLANALERLDNKYGEGKIDHTLRNFVEDFPPVSVYRKEQSVDQYLSGISKDDQNQWVSNREIALEEMIVLWITNNNPAAETYYELFDDRILRETTLYLTIISDLKEFFSELPQVEPDNPNLLDFLTSPFRSVPGSLIGQLEYMRTRWGNRIAQFIPRILIGLDFIKEETRPTFDGSPGPMIVPVFDESYPGVISIQGYPEYERFSPDTDWMPRLVLIAKNTYVWLDQLSRKYRKKISRLDEIPDEEIEILAKWGITGLWLIGIWERSPASRRIKQIIGNPEAVASAYSIYNYDIAQELGGNEALLKLQQQTYRRGVRLAADMVPNHMGLDSPWIINHPDWFISLDESPFPNYTYNGPNLSWDDRVGIFLEDHYYNRTDAAVVFKRVDFWTGTTKFIYHGNDGTAMPWNDTAQLNYLIPEVREAVIQTILQVARQFPIIRFDAAMTLAKKHYHRLWFPEPGSGGDIPTRAGLGLSKPDFDQVFPEEFWRNVVDRVSQEVPDTLLLAEAFWLMEGYFVRTLGMHRVYNSAFMNMLREEKNQEYRQVIKNTLEFDPEILKRYVNFMNNPDERTTVEQFGKGEKYFGICTLLATLPGLPMFGHGQIEGYSEKYGMEYRKAYWQEEIDENLVRNHEKLIFPLLRQRKSFAEVREFRLYDFFTPEGFVDEDVFAYSNSDGVHPTLVVYHNRHKNTVGWINRSTAYPVFNYEEKVFIQSPLADTLSIPDDPRAYLVFRDSFTDQEYLLPCSKVRHDGLYLELYPYHCHVYQNFRVVYKDEDHPYPALFERLGYSSTYRVDLALREMLFEEVITPFRNLFTPTIFQSLIKQQEQKIELTPEDTLHIMSEFSSRLSAFLTAVASQLKIDISEQFQAIISGQTRQSIRELEHIVHLPSILELDPTSKKGYLTNEQDFIQLSNRKSRGLASGDSPTWVVFYSFIVLRSLGIFFDVDKPSRILASCSDWTLFNQISNVAKEMGLDQWTVDQSNLLVKLLINYQELRLTDGSANQFARHTLDLLFRDDEAKLFLNVNFFNEHMWFNKESFEEFVWWIYAIECFNTIEVSNKNLVKTMAYNHEYVRDLLSFERQSGFQVDKLLAIIRQ